MSKFIKIPVTKQMLKDLQECNDMADNGEEKNCCECSLNGGEEFGCMAEQTWRNEE